MTTIFLRIALSLVMIVLPWVAHAGEGLLPAQYSNAASPLAGTWHSGNFAYTFRDDGTYVYVGVMGTSNMRTQIAEQGTYRVDGSTLIIMRQSGTITNTNNYRQTLHPQTTTFPFALMNSANGPAMQLTYPTGNQLFYRR